MHGALEELCAIDGLLPDRAQRGAKEDRNQDDAEEVVVDKGTDQAAGDDVGDVRKKFKRCAGGCGVIRLLGIRCFGIRRTDQRLDFPLPGLTGLEGVHQREANQHRDAGVEGTDGKQLWDRALWDTDVDDAINDREEHKRHREGAEHLDDQHPGAARRVQPLCTSRVWPKRACFPEQHPDCGTNQDTQEDLQPQWDRKLIGFGCDTGVHSVHYAVHSPAPTLDVWRL